jgi:hypothetical protein
MSNVYIYYMIIMNLIYIYIICIRICLDYGFSLFTIDKRLYNILCCLVVVGVCCMLISKIWCIRKIIYKYNGATVVVYFCRFVVVYIYINKFTFCTKKGYFHRTGPYNLVISSTPVQQYNVWRYFFPWN